MSQFPITCDDCLAEFKSRDEMKEIQHGAMEYTYHCPNCTIEIFSITLSAGETLDSKIV